MTTNTTLISAVAVGDVLLMHGSTPVTVHRLQRLPRSGRIRIWVKPNRSRWSLVSESNLGSFRPTDTVEKVVD